MGQQQTDRSGEPPLGRCAVCDEPVTREDPGRMTFTAATGSMSTVHDRCEQAK